MLGITSQRQTFKIHQPSHSSSSSSAHGQLFASAHFSHSWSCHTIKHNCAKFPAAASLVAAAFRCKALRQQLRSQAQRQILAFAPHAAPRQNSTERSRCGQISASKCVVTRACLFPLFAHGARTAAHCLRLQPARLRPVAATGGCVERALRCAAVADERRAHELIVA